MNKNFLSLKLIVTLSAIILLGFSFSTIIKPTVELTGPPDPKVDKLKLPANFKAEHLYSPS